MIPAFRTVHEQPFPLQYCRIADLPSSSYKCCLLPTVSAWVTRLLQATEHGTLITEHSSYLEICEGVKSVAWTFYKQIICTLVNCRHYAVPLNTYYHHCSAVSFRVKQTSPLYLDCSILKKKALQSTCYNIPEDFNDQTNIFDANNAIWHISTVFHQYLCFS